MTESKPASKETIDRLIASFGSAIGVLHKELKDGLMVRSLMDEDTPLLYVLTQDLQNSIKFILIDVVVSCRADFSANKLYEKRFHMKNIQASISEGYKSLLNFGSLRKKSLWKKLMRQIHEEGYPELVAEGMAIDEKLMAFGDTEIDQELRNLTLHYDNEMIEVYNKTLSLDSEDDVVKKVSRFWDLLQDVELYTDNVDKYCRLRSGLNKPFPSFSTSFDINIYRERVCQFINEDGKIARAFNEIPEDIVGSLGPIADSWNTTKRVKTYMQNAGFVDDPAFGKLQDLNNIQLLLRFMMLDMAAIVNAFLRSSSDIESSFNLRRVCITKVSTMVHLYGYTSREYEQSIWRRIRDMVPNESYELISQSRDIDDLLRKMVSQSDDKDLRTTFVHLFDNSKMCSSVLEVMDAIEDIDPIIQLSEICSLLEISKIILNFVTILVDVFAQEECEKKIQVTKAINDQINKFIHVFEENELPEEEKKQVIEILEGIKGNLDDLMTL